MTKVRPRRVMGEMIDDAISALGLAAVARIPERTVVEQADVSRTPVVITHPHSSAALAYAALADHLEQREMIA